MECLISVAFVLQAPEPRGLSLGSGGGGSSNSNSSRSRSGNSGRSGSSSIEPKTPVIISCTIILCTTKKEKMLLVKP